MRVDIYNDVEPEWWNQLIEQSGHGSIYQTYHWNAFYREFAGYDLKFLVCHDRDSNPAGLLVVKVGAVGHLHFLERTLGAIAQALLKRAYPAHSWEYGPVLLAPREQWNAVASALLREVRKLRGTISRCNVPLEVSSDGLEGLRGMLQVSEWGTYVIDLERSEEELWEGLKSTGRKAGRRAEREGSTVRTLQGEEDQIAYQQFRDACMKRRGSRSFSVNQTTIRNRWLSQIAAEDIYVAEFEGQMISSLVILRFGGWVHELAAHQSQMAHDRKLYGGDMIKWEVIRRESAEGATAYDLCGVNPEPATPKEQDIDRFKKKWGGERVLFPVFSD